MLKLHSNQTISLRIINEKQSYEASEIHSRCSHLYFDESILRAGNPKLEDALDLQVTQTTVSASAHHHILAYHDMDTAVGENSLYQD